MSVYSVANFGPLVLSMIVDPIDGRDLVWICNQLVRLAHRYRNDCVDSFRVCRDNCGEPTSAYLEAVTCCGSSDQQITNKVTGNKFWIGCNYGH